MFSECVFDSQVVITDTLTEKNKGMTYEIILYEIILTRAWVFVQVSIELHLSEEAINSPLYRCEL